MAEAALRRLLKHHKYHRRSFDEIKYHLHGFDEDELRKLLIRSGAVRMRSAQKGDVREWWGLVGRNTDHLEAVFGGRPPTRGWSLLPRRRG
jgi:hypothetical protein